MSEQVEDMGGLYLAEGAESVVPEGYIKTDIGIFPEGWKVKPLSALTKLMTNGFVGPAKLHYTDSHHGVTYIQGYNVLENGFDFHGIKKVTLEFHRKNSKSNLRAGDLLMVQTGDVGLVTVVTPELEGANCHALIINRFKPAYESKYFAYLLNSDYGRQRLKELETGTTMKHINVGDLLHFEIPFPSLKKEQTAIATALSDVDALISEQEKLIAKKQAIKTATMQQLLTGRTRLPQFALREDGSLKGYKQSELGEVPEDWEVSTIGENTEWKSGGTPNRSNEEYWNGSIPWISGSTLKFFELTTSDQFLSDIGVKSGSNMAPLGAVLLLVRGSALHNVIRVGVVAAPMAFNQDVKALVPSKNLEPRFLTSFIMAMEGDLLKLVSSAGNSAGVLDTELVKNFGLLLPAVEEQKVISSVLSNMDQEIKGLQVRLAKTRQIKQGMMQELLTGKTRLLNPLNEDCAND